MTEDTARSDALGLAALLAEHQAEEVVVLDVSSMSDWTDFFVIATVRSRAHLRGLIRHLYEFLDSRRIVPLNHRRAIQEEGWVLLDCGAFVIHLMEPELRGFYELEKLWFKAERLYSSNSS